MPAPDRQDVVDSHVHVGGAKYPPIEDYLAAMTECGVDAAVLVQALGEQDAGYLEDCRRSHPGSFAGVAFVDVTDPVGARRVAALGERGMLNGVRVRVRDTADVGLLAGLLDPLARHRLVVSVHGEFTALASDALLRLVERSPDVQFRFEHLGCLRLADDPAPYPGFRRFLRLAGFANASTTWSGFFLNAAKPYPYPDAEPYLRMSLDAFGAHRIMWSGDWNRPGNSPAGYRGAVRHVIEHMPFLDEEQRRSVLAGTARTIFRIGEPHAVA